MTEWIETARRGENHHVLFMEWVMNMYAENQCGRSFGPDVEFVPEHYRQFNGARWFSRSDLERYQALIEIVCQTGRILDMAEAYIAQIDRTRTHAEKAKHKPYDDASADELAAAFDDLSRTAIDHWQQAYHYIILGRFMPDRITQYVSKQMPGVQKQTECLLTLFTSDRPTEMRREAIDLVQMAETFQGQSLAPDSANANAAIKNHLEKYAHLGRYYLRGKPFTTQDIQTRISALSPDAITQKKKEFTEQQSVPEKSRRIMDELDFSEDLRRGVAAIKAYAYASNHADETYGYFVSAHAGLLRELCLQLDVSWNELGSARIAEIKNALERQKPFDGSQKRVLRQRFTDNAIELENKQITLIEGDAYARYAAAENAQQQTMAELTEVRGISGSPGSRQGKARIVRTAREIGKVVAGDVLITAMTTPEFVPAMQRACAIVTDEGGILCHAAIVSRELHIPCVVGTKHATRAFQDGDILDVDASAGIVRKV